MLKFKTSILPPCRIEGFSPRSLKDVRSFSTLFGPRTMAYIFEIPGEAARVARREVPRDPDAPVRRTVSFSDFRYDCATVLFGQNVNSVERWSMMRWTISVEEGWVSRE